MSPYVFLRHVTICLCLLSNSLLLTAKPAEQTAQPKPISFIENKGQVTDEHLQQRRDIQYKLDVPGMTIFIGNGALHYQWIKAVNKPAPVDIHPGWELERERTVPFETYRLDMTLKNANLTASAVAAEEQGYYETYYLPHIPAEGTVAHSYNRITYRNIYPNIDWTLYTRNGQLKYDFIVHAGGNVSDIQMQYEGSTQITQSAGRLIIETPFGSITEEKPFTYNAETRQEISSAYITSGNLITFSVANAGQACVIDPTLLWSTYYGGTLDDIATAIATDLSGNAYIGGHTISANNIATSGSYKNLITSIEYDAYVLKMDGDGNRLWGTYFGGYGADYCNAIAFARFNLFPPSKEGVCIAGNTYSNTGISTNATSYNASNKSDGYFAIINSTGTKTSGGYLGGEGDDVATSAALALNYNNYGDGIIGGYTSSLTFGGSSSMFQPNNAGGFDGFHTIAPYQFKSEQTFLGGPGDDYIEGVAISPSGNFYVTGTTSSATGMTFGSPMQATIGGGRDGFIANVNTVYYKAPVWGTYWGGAGDDYLTAISFIDDNNFALCGYSSGNGLATAGTHQQTNAGSEDGLVARFSTAGQLAWASYTGGAGSDKLTSVDIDINNHNSIYLGGYTFSNAGIASAGAVQNGLSGTCDAMLAIFDNDNGTRKWGSYYGGSSVENFPVGVSTTAGNFYFAGGTYSSNLNVVNAHQQSPGGDMDGFAGCISADTGMYITEQSLAAYKMCGYSQLNVEIKTTNNFNPGNTFILYMTDATLKSAQAIPIDTLISTTGGTILVTLPNITGLNSLIQVYVVSSDPVRTTYINNFNLNYSATPTTFLTIYCGAYPGNVVQEGTPLLFALTVPNNTTGTYQWQKNGVDIPGATNDTLLAIAGTDIMDGDSLWCIYTTPVGNCNIDRSFASTVIHMTVTLGVDEISRQHLRIYPNPTGGTFTVSGLNSLKAEHFTITDVMGKVVYSSKPGNADALSISLPASLPNGLYLLKVQTAKGELQSKLSLQR